MRSGTAVLVSAAVALLVGGAVVLASRGDRGSAPAEQPVGAPTAAAAACDPCGYPSKMMALRVASLRGRVACADGSRAVAGAAVRLTDPVGAVASATTGADGSFAFADLPVGTPVRIEAVGDGYEPAALGDLRLSAGEERDVGTLRLAAARAPE